MHQGRIRPAAIEAPWDVFEKSSEVSLDVDRSIPPPPAPDPGSIAEAAAVISAAKNPLIIVGAGAHGASEEIEALARLIQAPVTAHRSGKGVVSDDNPYSLLAPAAYQYWPDCDVVIGIGTRLEQAYFRWTWRPEGLKKVRIDIDPTEFDRLRPDVGILADARQGTVALIDALEKTIDRRADRSGEFAAYQAAADEQVAKITPQVQYLQAIRKVLPRDGFFVEEVSQAGFTARIAFPVYAPKQYVTCGYQDNLGFGFHTAIGVKVANPDKCVVSICGDGGFMFGVQELATAVKYRINLVTVVFDNGGFENVRRDQATRFGGTDFGSDLVNPDFVRMAEAFGAKGVSVNSPEALAAAVEEGFGEDGPVLIVVPVEPGSESSPWPLYHPAPP